MTDCADAAIQPPLCWITNAYDRSAGGLLWVRSQRGGPLNGALLNLSYGTRKVFLVPHESVGGQIQGGMIELRIIDGKVRFDINLLVARAANLQLSSQLLQLANRVVQ